MKKYYTRVCNFAYGRASVKLIDKKKNLPLNGNKEFSFSQIEIITRNSKKIINLKDILIQFFQYPQSLLLSDCNVFQLYSSQYSHLLIK